MVLVLGRPGSGCSTFLKIIANNREEYSEVRGNVSYGGITAEEFRSSFPNEAVYSTPEDVHLASLTVQQTLDFAVQMKAPGSRLPDQSLIDYKNEVVSALLKIFNLSHVKDTLVGDAQIRGISGGQRKRVSIAEMMISGATVCCWDNSTLGLDAVSATDYIRCLRILTNVYRSTTFVSLYQASDIIYEHFDKILLLEDGHQLYFGPATGAQQYFESLGFTKLKGQSVPDFLTASVDQRQMIKSTSIKFTVESLALKYQESAISAEERSAIDSYCKSVDDETLLWDLSLGTASSTQCIGLKWNNYSASFMQQVMLTFKRHALLKLQDRFSLTVQTATSIIVALLCGSIYFQLPKTSTGAFTRGGVIFITLLYNAFTAFAELPTTMFCRPVLIKHKAFGFHCSSALYIGQILFDIPMAAAQILLFSVIVYFMAGLEPTAQRFLVFYALLVVVQAAMTVFFRILGIVSRTFDGAIRLACIIVILLVLTSGYLVPIQDMSHWVSWFYWINPTAYGFSALMMNEFRGLFLTCTTRDLVPSGPSYQDIAYQTCTLPGSISGTNLVDGAEYLKKSFSYDVQNLGRNGGILVLFMIGLLILNVLVGEWIPFTGSGTSMKTFLKTETKDHTTRTLSPKSTDPQLSSPMAGALEKIHYLTWESLDYTVPSTGTNELQLLHEVSGYVESGCLMALMGASGAGKSTLLDVLCSRKTTGTVRGKILADGNPVGGWFKRGVGYCEQLDIHEPTQTVREALRFSAYLRQPHTVAKEEKNNYVEELISLLEMEDFSNALIGTTQRGLSVEERKKLSIGVELAAKPEILLFLDEPTSGLDSQSAINILRLLRRLADSGQAIICTIHQPNSSIFRLFDKLLLLSEGRTIFFGPMDELEGHFAAHGAICPPDANIAEFMLRVLNDGEDSAQAAVKWNRHWLASIHYSKMQERIRALTIPSPPSDVIDKIPSRGSYLYHLKLVTARASVSLWRTPEYGNTRLINHISVGLITGLAYLNIGNSRADLQYRVFVIFQLTVLPSMILSQIQPRFELARTIFMREKSSEMYEKGVFLLSVTIAELPHIIVCSVIFFICMYFPTSFSRIPEKSSFQFLMVVLTELFSVFLGLTVAALTPSAYIASLFTPFLLVTFSLFCGVTVPPPSIPKFWRAWLYRLNPFTYLVGGMMETELGGRKVECTLEEFQTFVLPTNTTCMDYARKFLETAVGYFENPQSTTTCAYCPFKNGDSFIDQFGLSATNRWKDLGIFAAFCGSTFVLFIIAGSRINWSRR
ncbi:putative ABC transporter G family member 11 [Tricladium varicosporioides]|nr:putative ABC transporter G family member 11 [Hymenoscyphus varicosporioides]